MSVESGRRYGKIFDAKVTEVRTKQYLSRNLIKQFVENLHN